MAAPEQAKGEGKQTPRPAEARRAGADLGGMRGTKDLLEEPQPQTVLPDQQAEEMQPEIEQETADPDGSSASETLVEPRQLAICDVDSAVEQAPPEIRTIKVGAHAAPAHLILFRDLAKDHSLAFWAAKYVAEEVAGVQAANTLDAKSRDLVGFVTWFVGINGAGQIGAWMPRDTQAYLNSLETQGRAPSTINRVFATLRHFARWAHELPGGLFEVSGLPTRGVKELAIDEPDCQKLDKKDVHRLFKAADRLVLTEVRDGQRPRRNRAILAMLYYTGLRVSELVALRRVQYDGRYLTNVKRKGKARSKGVYIGIECRRMLDEYLIKERKHDGIHLNEGALFARKGTSEPLTRQMIGIVLKRLAQEASKHDGVEGGLLLHPHRLRHTFGAEYRDKTGSDTETATALGHASLNYVGRYVRKSQQEREEVIDRF